MKEGGYPTRIQGCSNNSPIMLKSVTAIETSLYCIVYCRKDTVQILLTRLHECLDQAEILPVSQCGLRKARRPIGMILSARHFQQKYQKQTGPQHDLCLQCQSFWHSQPWWALENYNNIWLSSQVISNCSSVHWGILARLQNDREYS